MKQSLAILLSLSCLAAPAWAQSTFDSTRGEIAVPCVSVWDSRQVVGVDSHYRVLLRDRGTSSHFAIADIAPIDYDTECGGVFDLATKRYTDIVNIGDESWNVSLRRGSDDVFTLESVTPRGAAQTSLWVARSGGHRVFLAGAVHVLRASDYPLPRAFDEAYAQSARLYFERDLDAPGEEGFGSSAGIAAMMRDPEGLTLRQQLEPRTYERLRDYLRSTWNLGMEQVNAWSAQMFVSTFSFSHMERVHGVSAVGVDGYLANRARADGKPIDGFETAAQQLAMLQAMDAGREDELVRTFLDACATNANLADFDRLVSLWRLGDTGALNREEIAPMREADYADYELIQIQRNEAWLPRIEALLRTPETEMVVVGVAHMTGRDGLVARLRQLGYHVEKY
ncbi:MAG TPA: TraB/GumN family protein [Pseudomonadales bacterium]